MGLVHVAKIVKAEDIKEPLMKLWCPGRHVSLNSDRRVYARSRPLSRTFETPVPHVGHLGVFKIELDALAKVRKQI